MLSLYKDLQQKQCSDQQVSSKETVTQNLKMLESLTQVIQIMYQELNRSRGAATQPMPMVAPYDMNPMHTVMQH